MENGFPILIPALSSHLTEAKIKDQISWQHISCQHSGYPL